MPPSRRERERRLEQMRALDNDMVIAAVATTTLYHGGIDTPNDYRRFVDRVTWDED